MDEAPATPSPNVSDDDSEAMNTDDEDAILYTGQGQQSESSSDGFQHVLPSSISVHRAVYILIT